MVESEMTKLVQRVATLEANCKVHSEDIGWMKRAIANMGTKLTRVETALWGALIIGQLLAAALASWLSK